MRVTTSDEEGDYHILQRCTNKKSIHFKKSFANESFMAIRKCDETPHITDFSSSLFPAGCCVL